MPAGSHSLRAAVALVASDSGNLSLTPLLMKGGRKGCFMPEGRRASVGGTRTVERFTPGWSGCNHFFFTPAILCSHLPSSPPPAPPSSASAFLSAPFVGGLLVGGWRGFRGARPDPSLPYRNTPGVRPGPQRGDLHSST